MATQFPELEETHISFIGQQPVVFTGTAGPDGRVNVSPKGGDCLRVLSPTRILWRNLTGSGNETAGHLLQTNRMTLMWCSFTARPLILRVYGTARTVHADDPGFPALDGRFAPDIGARQIYDMTVDLVQTSCGYGVPMMDLREERTTLDTWTQDRGADGIRAYWRDRNGRTIDGAPTR